MGFTPLPQATDHLVKCAIPNGTRVRKVHSEPGDANHDGALGAIQSSFGPIGEDVASVLHAEGILDAEPSEFCYFVVWDDYPGLPVFTRGRKVEGLAWCHVDERFEPLSDACEHGVFRCRESCGRCDEYEAIHGTWKR